MIFGFDEHKGKVDVGAMLTQLQTNFQDNVNTLYNAFVAKGVTPAAKTVSAIVTAVTTLYNKGVTDAQAISWTEVLDFTAACLIESGAFATGMSYSVIDLTNVVSAKCTSISSIGSGTNTYRYEFLNSSKTSISSGSFTNGTTFSIPSNAKYLKVKLETRLTTTGGCSASASITFGKQAKKLR